MLSNPVRQNAWKFHLVASLVINQIPLFCWEPITERYISRHCFSEIFQSNELEITIKQMGAMNIWGSISFVQ